MAIPVVGDILDKASSLLNDASKTIFTNAAMLPLFNTAQQELSELMELNNVPYTNKASTTLTIAATVTTISSVTSPALPTDLVEIQGILERLNGATEDYIPMTRAEFLPPYVELTESLIWWTWQGQAIFFIGATTDRQLQLNYIGNALATATTTTSPVALFNATSFLQYRTASLVAEFLGENKDRADSLNTDAGAALDRFLGISAKGRQAIATRRRPFMAAYKTRGY